MKKILLTLGLIAFSLVSKAQDITGRWYGLLDVMGMQMPLEFNITEENAELKATMDSPEQKAFNIPVSHISFENNTLKLEVEAAKLSYTGQFIDAENIKGTFSQMGQDVAMNLSKTKKEKTKINHPQEPQEPFPYRSEEITFENKAAGIKLSGTLTLPAVGKKFPVVVLITGSGPQDRNSELLGHKPFLLWADYLTRRGIAVLRYDERGIGKSEGKFSGSTSADFASDAEAALAFLKTRKDIDKKKIGLIGHSEGGIIAPMIAARNKAVHFVVMLAGTGLRGDQLLLMQQELVAKVSGISDEDIASNRKLNEQLFYIILNAKNDDQMKTDMRAVLEKTYLAFTPEEIPSGLSMEQFVQMNIGYYSDPWILYFLRFDPQTSLSKVKCPVYAVNGDKDLQVPAKENLEAIAKYLTIAGNSNFKTQVFPGLNHLFQESSTGNPEEYAKIEQTLSPVILEAVSSWISSITK